MLNQRYGQAALALQLLHGRGRGCDADVDRDATRAPGPGHRLHVGGEPALHRRTRDADGRKTGLRILAA